jgi:hypothetical protein
LERRREPDEALHAPKGGLLLCTHAESLSPKFWPNAPNGFMMTSHRRAKRDAAQTQKQPAHIRGNAIEQ